MIALLRILVILPVFILICTTGSIFCLIRPFHKNNTLVIARTLGALAPLFGIKLIVRVPKRNVYTPQVFIANHQNTYDLVTLTAAVSEGTVSIGKNSIRWLPFFGQLYWLCGNILIDRNNRTSARKTIDQVCQRIVDKKLSVWMFPEGTRSRGKGLLAFKMGAFHTAIHAKVPIVPVVLSTTTNFKLNCLNNGYAIVEMLEPIDSKPYHTAKALAADCQQLMSDKIVTLDREVSILNQRN